MRLFTKIESFNLHTIFDNYNQFTTPDAFSFFLCNYFIVLQFSKNDFYTHFEFYQCISLRLYEKIGFEWLDNFVFIYSFSFILFFGLNECIFTYFYSSSGFPFIFSLFNFFIKANVLEIMYFGNLNDHYVKSYYALNV